MQKQPAWLSNPEIKTYFTSLPTMIQEAIYQSGVQFSSVSQLRSFAKGLMEPS